MGNQVEQSDGDWPTFLGPRRNGTSLETGLLDEWPAKGPPLIWERPIGEGYSGPVVSRDRLILFHRVKKEEIIECINAVDVSQVYWKYAYPTKYVDRYGYSGGPRSSAAIDGDRVYTFGAEGVLTCLAFETGQLIWQRRVNKDYAVQQGFFGVGTAPVIEGNHILLNVGGPKGAGVVAFKKDTGEEAWKLSDDKASYSTPFVGAVRGERLAIFHTADGMLVVDPETGEEKYRYPFRSRIHESAIAATPVLVDDMVFLSATYNVGAVVLKLEPDGLKEVWKERLAMQNHWATSIYHEGHLYGMDGRHERGSNLRCIDFKTGEVLWTASKGLGRASFIMADGHFIAIGERGELALIEVNPDHYIEKSRARVLGYPVWTPPILARGLLYVRSNKVMKCFDLRASS
jgi:outer membrane protein assembly factor BamB